MLGFQYVLLADKSVDSGKTRASENDRVLSMDPDDSPFTSNAIFHSLHIVASAQQGMLQAKASYFEYQLVLMYITE